MNAQILLKHFDRIIEVPDAVAHLKRFVLDLAVRGKLVEQDANDEPASELIRCFEAEKARLVKSRKIRKPQVSAPITDQEMPIVAPTGWQWIRLGSASTIITKGSTPTSYGHAYTPEGINFIKVESIVNNQLTQENVTSFISEETHHFLGRSRLAVGDILFSIAGSIGTCAVVSAQILPANTNQALAIIRGTSFIFDEAFLLVCMRSSVSQLVRGKARGGGMNNVSLDDIQNFVVPVPPLAEQRRIAAKVDQVTILCERLALAQKQREDLRRHLLESVLYHSLSPLAIEAP